MPKTRMCPSELLNRSLTGFRIVVTGANSGIGLVTAQQLLRQGATVVFGCRRPEQADAAIAEFRADHPDAKTESYPLDLGDLASVRAFAASVRDAGESVDILINNAGVMNTDAGKTKDGFETQLGVNHIGHFALTEALLPALASAAESRGEARVVNVSSCYHDRAMGRDGRIDLEDPFFERRKYDGWESYAQSKLANVLHACEFAKRHADKNIKTASVHPGWVRTNLARHTMPVFVQDYLMRPALRLAGMIEPWEGAQTSLFVALTSDLESGAYYSQVGLYRDKACKPGGWPLRSPNPQAHDDTLAAALYDQSLTWIGAPGAV